MLTAIGSVPESVLPTSQQSLGQEKRRFKLDVRKLKELGLTESLPVGYRLSPRGHAVLRAELAERRERRAAHTGD